MKTLTKFIYVASGVLTLGMSAATVNGAVKGSRPRPTPAPRPTPPLTADVGSSYSNSKVPYPIDLGAVIAAIGFPAGYPAPVAYGDFNRDGIPDVVFHDPFNPNGEPPTSLVVSPEAVTSIVPHN